jgi:hypothetical protein
MMLSLQFAARPLKKLGQAIHLPQDAATQWAIGGAALIVCAAVVAMGIRSLSGDYLAKVWTIAHGGAAVPRGRRQSFAGDAVAHWLGGPPARCGFEYVRRMLARDWQLRKQMIPALAALIGPVTMMVRDWPNSPYAEKFAMAHLMPHVLGVIVFFLCMLLAYGSDYKGAWVFQLAPGPVYDQFAAGAYALLWLWGVGVPHLLMLPAVCWAWGLWQGALFTAFSAALASTYLALEIRLVEGVPFGRQFEAKRQQELLPVIFVGLLVTAIVVAAQHYLLFRSPVYVATATAVAAAGAWWLTRRSLAEFADAIRFQLETDSRQSGDLYVEL